MKTIKGPAIFLAQFAADKAPFNAWDNITKWAASLGYKGVQIPTWDARFFDLEVAAEIKLPKILILCKRRLGEIVVLECFREYFHAGRPGSGRCRLT